MKTKVKSVQVHYQCVCGYNEVYPDELLIPWKDFSKQGIKRRKDKKTGKPFLFTKINVNVCPGHFD